MTHTWTKSAVAAAVGAALAVSPARATEPSRPDPGKADVSQSVKADILNADVKADLDRLARLIEEQTKLLGALQDDVRKIKDDLRGVRSTDNAIVRGGLIEDVQKLNGRLEQMEGSLRRLQNDYTALRPASGANSGAGATAAPGGPLSSIPSQMPGGGVTPPAAATDANRSTVRIVNEYPVEISMVVNERSYRVGPTAKLDVTVPAGNFTYQLLQAGVPPTSSSIKDREVVTLRVK